MTADTKFRKTLSWLRRNFPPPRPVAVRRKELRCKSLAETSLSGQRLVVVIKRRQSWRLQADCLLHEWAHVLTWHGNDKDDHGEEWGLQYARIYREWVAWNYGR